LQVAGNMLPIVALVCKAAFTRRHIWQDSQS
jgi:hypothetical protein